MKSKVEPVRLLHVEMELGGALRPVGRLAWQRGRIFFEYDPAFIASGRSISPIKLPLEQRVFPGELEPFDGLHGVFNDSLPDGWGRLLMDRSLSALGMIPSALTPLDRLAYVGSRGLGALRYRPEHGRKRGPAAIDLDRLAELVQAVLDGDVEDVLDRLIDLGGSSGGARPKVLVGCNRNKRRLVAGVGALPVGYSHWLVKFRSSVDPPDMGAIEYAYSEMARAAGVDMAPTHLFPASEGPGYFGTQRFDRRGAARVHVHSICGLLHADHRLPSVHYDTLLNATRRVTGSQVEVDRMFRRMVFNVLAHNRDDHTKNHAFLLDDDGEWRCTPAYDVTFSSGPGGEHALAIDGEGRQPGVAHITAVARRVGVNDKLVRACVDQVKAAVDRWPDLAAAAGVLRATATDIDVRLNGPRPAPRRRGAAAVGAPGRTPRRRLPR
jgi:serine/threonine-protein kinase HipA